MTSQPSTMISLASDSVFIYGRSAAELLRRRGESMRPSLFFLLLAPAFGCGQQTVTPTGSTVQDPESKHVVEVSKTSFIYRHPDGRSITMAWDDLTRVEIVTNDKGPIEPDV